MAIQAPFIHSFNPQFLNLKMAPLHWLSSLCIHLATRVLAWPHSNKFPSHLLFFHKTILDLASFTPQSLNPDPEVAALFKSKSKTGIYERKGWMNIETFLLSSIASSLAIVPRASSSRQQVVRQPCQKLVHPRQASLIWCASRASCFPYYPPTM